MSEQIKVTVKKHEHKTRDAERLEPAMRKQRCQHTSALGIVDFYGFVQYNPVD